MATIRKGFDGILQYDAAQKRAPDGRQIEQQHRPHNVGVDDGSRIQQQRATRDHGGQLQVKSAAPDMLPAPQKDRYQAERGHKEINDCDPQAVQPCPFQGPKGDPEKSPRRARIKARKRRLAFNRGDHGQRRDPE